MRRREQTATEKRLDARRRRSRVTKQATPEYLKDIRRKRAMKNEMARQERELLMRGRFTRR